MHIREARKRGEVVLGVATQLLSCAKLPSSEGERFWRVVVSCICDANHAVYHLQEAHDKQAGHNKRGARQAEERQTGQSDPVAWRFGWFLHALYDGLGTASASQRRPQVAALLRGLRTVVSPSNVECECADCRPATEPKQPREAEVTPETARVAKAEELPPGQCVEHDRARCFQCSLQLDEVDEACDEPWLQWLEPLHEACSDSHLARRAPKCPKGSVRKRLDALLTKATTLVFTEPRLQETCRRQAPQLLTRLLHAVEAQPEAREQGEQTSYVHQQLLVRQLARQQLALAADAAQKYLLRYVASNF